MKDEEREIHKRFAGELNKSFVVTNTINHGRLRGYSTETILKMALCAYMKKDRKEQERRIKEQNERPPTFYATRNQGN